MKLHCGTLPYGQKILAAIAGAPKNPESYNPLRGSTEDDVDAVNMIRVGTPEQLETLLRSYALITSDMPAPAGMVREKIGHELEHREAAVALGATAIEYGLFVPHQPRFSWRHMRRMFPFELSMMPEGLDDEEILNVTAYPTNLSLGDQWALHDAGLTVTDIDLTAKERDWPRPLSLPKE